MPDDQEAALKERQERELQLQSRRHIREKQDEYSAKRARFEKDGDGEADFIEQQGRIFAEEIYHTREAALDSELLKQTTETQVKRAKTSSKAKKKTISWLKFREGLTRLYADDDGDSTVAWEEIGSFALKQFQCAPTGQFMLGALDVGSTAKKREVKERAKKQAAPTAFTEMNNLGENMKDNDRPDNAHETQIGDVKAAVDNNTRDNPLELYRLAVNPKSFGQTVENLFAISFLVKENYAEHTVSADGKQYIQTLLGTEEMAKKVAAAGDREACILRLEYSDFDNWCKVLKNQPPLIPHRVES